MYCGIRACRRKKLLARNAEIYRAMRSRFTGIDIVAAVVRQCAINRYLRDMAGRDSPVEARDALLGEGGKTYDLVLTNRSAKSRALGLSETTARSTPNARITIAKISSSRPRRSNSNFCSAS
jgi:hypothetical protein